MKKSPKPIDDFFNDVSTSELLDMYETMVHAQWESNERLENTDCVHQSGHYKALTLIDASLHVERWRVRHELARRMDSHKKGTA